MNFCDFLLSNTLRFLNTLPFSSCLFSLQRSNETYEAIRTNKFAVQGTVKTTARSLRGNLFYCSETVPVAIFSHLI